MRISTALCIVFLASSCKALDNGLALTPPMGFMTWERFRCNTDCENDPDNCISENLIKAMADRLAEDGYRDAGYVYIIIDDCWQSRERDSEDRLQPDPDRFPNGIKSLADYVHSQGLKFGIYSDFGNFTCGGYPGSLGHLETDAQTFADWGVDYLKFDGCYVDLVDMPIGYPQMGQYLNDTGRPIVYSCSWPAYFTGEHLDPDYDAIAKACNLWRNWDDIQDSWDSVRSIFDYFAYHQDELIPVAGPGHWNDPDMLIVGDFGLSYDESKAQMAIWAILTAPLLISADLRTISTEFSEILLNKDIIGVNQDSLGIQGSRIYKTYGIQGWTKPIQPLSSTNDYSYAVAFVNENSEIQTVTNTLTDLGLNFTSGYNVIDLYDGTDYGLLKPEDDLVVKVNPSGVVFLKATVAN